MLKRLLVLTMLSVSTCAIPALAVPVLFEIDGEVTAVDVQNPFGFAPGDTINVSATFDDGLISGSGSSAAELGQSGNASAGALNVEVGGITFIASHDVEYVGDIFPVLDFLDGVFLGLDFLVEGGFNNAAEDFSIQGLGFDGAGGLFGLLTLDTLRISTLGRLNANTAVPEPGSLALVMLVVIATLTRALPKRVRLCVGAS